MRRILESSSIRFFFILQPPGGNRPAAVRCCGIGRLRSHRKPPAAGSVFLPGLAITSTSLRAPQALHLLHRCRPEGIRRRDQGVVGPDFFSDVGQLADGSGSYQPRSPPRSISQIFEGIPSPGTNKQVMGFSQRSVQHVPQQRHSNKAMA